jgi:hypothetical protein
MAETSLPHEEKKTKSTFYIVLSLINLDLITIFSMKRLYRHKELKLNKMSLLYMFLTI